MSILVPESKKKRPPAKPFSDKEWDALPTTQGLLGQAVDVDNFLDIDSILGEEILITDVADREGSFGDYVTVVAKRKSGEVIGFNTGSKVLLKQLERIKDKFPMRAQIKKQKRYYTLV